MLSICKKRKKRNANADRQIFIMMIKTIKLTKKSKEQLRDQHIGTGTIVLKSSETEIRYINFYVGRNDGKIYSSGTGKLIETINI